MDIQQICIHDSKNQNFHEFEHEHDTNNQKRIGWSSQEGYEKTPHKEIFRATVY